MRILSMSWMPLRFSRCSARTQYGQTSVQYMMTFAMSLLQRQAGFLPCHHAAAEVVSLCKALLAQECARRCRTLAAAAHHDDGTLAVFFQFADTRTELAQRDELAVQDVSGVVLALLAHIQNE